MTMDAVLGIAGCRHDATVALRHGGLAAAASEDSFVRVAGIGYAQTGGFPTLAVEACLTRAGLTASDVIELAVVDDRDGAGESGRARAGQEGRALALPAGFGNVRWIDPIHADAIQAAASVPIADAVLVIGMHPPNITAFARHDGELRCLGSVAGCERLASVASALACALGGDDADPYRSLERIGAGGAGSPGTPGSDDEFLDACTEALGWRAPLALSVNQERMTALVDELSAGLPGGLADSATPNVRVRDRRRALAASFMMRIADLVRDAAEDICRSTGGSTVVLGGTLFENPRLNTRIKQLLEDRVSFAAVPGLRGRAIGASLSGSPLPAGGLGGLGGLALGPSFSEYDIKTTLENCRLDYVYEPDWARLLVRVSKMLSRGTVVGWFQGPTGFGPRSLGTRSVLCDPSMPYARENLNTYLKRLPIAEPLPVSMTPSVADESLMASIRSPYMLFDAPVRDSARARVRAALDHRHRLQIHTVTPDQAPELCELLGVHFDRTHVPGLININLSGPDEPTACTPRDAVRTVFSSATDALVIGRFLLMKDYWLLRDNRD
jgi:predicted NodU family carbamoyl transferase